MHCHVGIIALNVENCKSEKAFFWFYLKVISLKAVIIALIGVKYIFLLIIFIILIYIILWPYELA